MHYSLSKIPCFGNNMPKKPLNMSLMNELFQVKSPTPYYLRDENDLYSRNSKTVTYGTESVSFMAPKIIFGTTPLLKGGVNLFCNCHSWGGVRKFLLERRGYKEKRGGLIYSRRGGITFLLLILNFWYIVLMFMEIKRMPSHKFFYLCHCI